MSRLVGGLTWLPIVVLASSVLFSGLGASAAVPPSISPKGPILSWHNQVNNLQPPSARARVGFTYDAADHYMVLYGGYNAPSLYYDTWGYSSGLWSQLNPAKHPTAPVGLTLTYDPALKGVLAFGGTDPFSSPSLFNDTWLFQAGNWTQLAPVLSPPARGYYEMTYDPAISAVLLFGGDAGGITLSDTWEFNGTNWIQLHPATNAPGTESGAMVFDSASNQVLLMGGYNSTSGQAPTGTWAYSGGNWTLIPHSHMPSRVWFQASTLKNGQPVFFGGQTGSSFATCGVAKVTVCNQTYVFYSGFWHSVRASHPPSPRRNGGFAYDPRDGYDVYFGGVDSSLTWYSETWALK